MKRVMLMVGLAVFLVGCASVKQAVQDYKTGKASDTTGVVSAQAEQTGQIIKDLPVPYAGPIGAAVTFLVGTFLFWKRGVAIRKTGAAPVVPSTGMSMFTSIEQFAANVMAGVFTTTTGTSSTASSVWQRIWKVALATVAGAGSLAVAYPAFMTVLTGHPVLESIFIALTSGVAGLEKGLSNVPVVAVAAPAGGATA